MKSDLNEKAQPRDGRLHQRARERLLADPLALGPALTGGERSAIDSSPPRIRQSRP